MTRTAVRRRRGGGALASRLGAGAVLGAVLGVVLGAVLGGAVLADPPPPTPHGAPAAATAPPGGSPSSSVSVQSSAASVRPQPVVVSSPRALHHRRGRLLLIGDSMVFNLCPLVQSDECVSYPGGWVAAIDGENLTDRFVTQADPQPGDTVVLSSIGGFHSPGVDDTEILARLNALYQRLQALQVHLIVLVAPLPAFPICLQPLTPEAEALYGGKRDELCATGIAIAQLERSWPVTELTIEGPYGPDNLHQTTEAELHLAALIQAAR